MVRNWRTRWTSSFSCEMPSRPFLSGPCGPWSGQQALRKELKPSYQLALPTLTATKVHTCSTNCHNLRNAKLAQSGLCSDHLRIHRPVPLRSSRRFLLGSETSSQLWDGFVEYTRQSKALMTRKDVPLYKRNASGGRGEAGEGFAALQWTPW